MFKLRSLCTLVLLTAGMLTIISFSAVLAQDDPAEIYNQALTHQQEGQTELAVLEYKQVIEADPGYIDAYLNLGVIYFEQKKYADALGLFKTASEKDATSVDAFANMGRVEYKLRRYAESAAAFQTALALDASQNDLYGELAKAFYRQKNYVDLVTALEAGHAKGAGDHTTHYLLGKGYQKTSKDTKAIGAFRESVKKKANYNAQFALGQIYQSQEKYKQAGNAFKAALNLKPKKSLAAYNYAIALESLDSDALDTNIKNWQNFVKIGKNDPKVRNQVSIAEGHIKELKDSKAAKDLQ